MLHAFHGVHAVDNNNKVQLFLKPRLHDTTGCLQPVVKPVEQPVEQPAASCKRGFKETRLTQRGGWKVAVCRILIHRCGSARSDRIFLKTTSAHHQRVRSSNPCRHSPCNDHFCQRIVLYDVSFRVSPIPYLTCTCWVFKVIAYLKLFKYLKYKILKLIKYSK